MPLVELYLDDKDATITKKIEKDVIIGLILLEFNNWECYILSYLFSFQKFRKTFNQMISKINNSIPENFPLDKPDKLDDLGNKTNYEIMVTNENDRNILICIK